DFLCGLNQGAGVSVDDALRFAGRARGIEKKRGGFGRQARRFDSCRLALKGWLVAHGDDARIGAGFCDGLFDFGQQRDALTSALQLGSREDDGGARIVETRGDGAWAEAGEDRADDEAQLETGVEDLD